MANANTEVTLPDIQTAIAAAIAAAFPEFATVEFDRDDEDENLRLPACLLQFDEAEPAPETDSGTGQWCARARFSARIVTNARKTAHSEVKVRAVALAAWLNLRRFSGIHADACEVISCMPDEFSPNVEKFRSWIVEFTIPAMFGNSAFAEETDGETPRSFFSFDPVIGIPNESEYASSDGET